MNLTDADIAPHPGESSGGADYLNDQDISHALLNEPALLAAATVLSELHGRVVPPGDLRARIEAVLRASEHARAGCAVLGGLRGALIDLPIP
jgi:hypothetical protein